ncbi:Putative DNA-binding domain-containing protein [Oceanospirillum multiglobuliferum]|uniref:Putative DNA-binding domain-containing protein n=1 Tax=Oceanospirillum multiglobuliferum TaxID=64969 RepID=A0A1T4PS63_9GAMM|nr:DNA-binding domain-containing protein [Oceanospirillum multiglobuliferum]OPX55355.1 hypothetical protein BTE48_09320 [Oceanospirillum multiglobuliferum]SJZ94096.1 Putative DNA-binding domain-containing protein [Oceanospirillum multiglobuliferum]
MSDLAQIQQNFAQALTESGTAPQLTQQIEAGVFSAEQKLQIYRNNFIMSLTDALQATYPVLAVMVGDIYFAQLAKAFIRQIPVQQPCISHFGDQLPQFMRGLESLEEHPYLPDLAQLEWYYSCQINRMPIMSQFPFTDFSKLDSTAQEHVVFTLNPSLVLFQSEWAVIELFQRIKRHLTEPEHATDPLQGFILEQPQCGWIKGSAMAEVEVQTCQPLLFKILQHCQQGLPFSQFSQDATQQGGPEIYSVEQLQMALQQLIASSVITSYHLAT